MVQMEITPSYFTSDWHLHTIFHQRCLVVFEGMKAISILVCTKVTQIVLKGSIPVKIGLVTFHNQKIKSELKVKRRMWEGLRNL